MSSKKYYSGILLFLSFFAYMSCELLIIPDIVIDEKEQKARISKFNSWIKEVASIVVVEADLNELNEVVFRPKSDLNAMDRLIEIDSKYCIDSDSIYGSSSLKEFVTELDKKYTLEDSIYFIIYLVDEYFNKNSKIRAFLDLLPTNLPSPAFNYDGIKHELNNELSKTVINKKIIDYHLSAKSRALMIYSSIIKEHPSLLNMNIFNEKNIEWAIYINDFYTTKLHER